ncbi:NAD-dependent epimerase/dehydratase family protein [Nucisporomicrobium flavum]|uniref:NAD-dependent epimerase/dehydratase family protein n=1 Tax=Nucisporomicrobium flavum TaxID=2785915 RepID=UPI003C306253
MTADASRPAAVVVGGTGCVGRRFCAALTDAGYRVVAVARHHPPRPVAAEMLALDVAATPVAELARTLAELRPAAVVNATGGWGLVEGETRDGALAVVAPLTEAVRRLPEPARFVHVGSIHEYGPVPRDGWITEETEPAPPTAYARTKLAESRHVLELIRAGHLDGVVLRLANTVGPDPAPESFFTVVATRLHRAGAEGIELDVTDVERDYVDSRDAASAVLAAIRDRGAGPLLNIGSGRALPIRELLRILVAAGGLPPSAVRMRAGAVTSRGADCTRIDISRARRLLHWRPRYTVDESMRATWDSVRAADGATSSIG